MSMLQTQINEKVLPGAHKDERDAYRQLRRRGFEMFAKPSGAGKDFPDFGLRTRIGDEVIDLHVEYKQDRWAQMGSMRDWSFNGSSFTASNLDSTKELLLDMMQSSDECVSNAKKLIKQLQKYCDPRITTISSGVLGVISDTAERRQKLTNFARQCDSYMLARITNDDLGQSFLNHYKRKFKPNPDATTSILIIMLGDDVYQIDAKGKRLTKTSAAQVNQLLGISTLPKMAIPTAQLEVRIQPWGLGNDKAVRIDVMASYRLKSVNAGATIGST